MYCKIMLDDDGWFWPMAGGKSRDTWWFTVLLNPKGNAYRFKERACAQQVIERLKAKGMTEIQFQTPA